MGKEKIMKRKKKIVLFEIMNLVVAVFAFTFLISLTSVGIVSGESYRDILVKPATNADSVPLKTGIGTGKVSALKGAIGETNKFQIEVNDATKTLATAKADLATKLAVDSSAQSSGDITLAAANVQSAEANLATQQTALANAQAYEAAALKAAGGVPNQATLAQMAGMELGGWPSALVSGLQWAAIAYGIGYLAGSLFGMNKQNTKALSFALAGGAFTYEFMASSKTILGLLGQNAQLYSGIAGIGVAAAIFIYMYKKTSTEAVTFDCKPYEAPVGGNYCEYCNKDKLRPCSEYRCRSLGQACQLLNSGTGKEACAWVNPKDVTSPTIAPFYDVLLKGYSYKDVKTRPPGTGMRVVRDSASDGCVKAFTPLTFGINTNEPTQCKIDYNHTINTRDVKNAYDSMAFYFGESSIYEYNHSQTMRLPGPAALAAQNISPEISNDGTYTLYVRCQDANGNVNEDEFAIRFCVEKGPDTTPPVIEGTSIPSGMPVAFNTNDTDIEVYVNEPADCKWSKQDKDYELMENTMTCDRNVYDINTNMLYKCFGKLTGLENRKDNEFYFRCKDQPYLENQNDRFTNTESYKFIIKGSQPLNIKANSVKPNGTVQGYADVVTVDLTLETENGYNKGDAICYFSTSTVDSTFIKMFETGTNKHKQNQQLISGTYTYYFKCVDLGGNADYNQTSFTVQVDRQAPQVVRVYNEGSNLKIETDEKSNCYYSENVNNKCNYELKDGKQMLYQNVTAHYIEWKTNNNLYVKCVDTSGNQPNPVDCSIIVRPYNSK